MARGRPAFLRRLFAVARYALALGGICAQAVRGAETPAEVIRGKQVASEIGCAQCHADLAPNPTLRAATPDLSSAGLRYQSAWIFEFLQNPRRVRQHLGRARMPNFQLSTKEALALTAFLETQRHIGGTWPAIPTAVTAVTAAGSAARPNVSKEQFDAELSRGLICLTCHDYAGNGGHRAVELTNVSVRLRPEWIRQYLVAPARFGVPPATMPEQFFELTADRSNFREITPDAARKIHAVTDHLFSINDTRRAALEQKLTEARRAFPGLTPGQGETMFRALNCAGCHRHHSILPASQGVGPPLASEGLRVQKPWLDAFLTRPKPVRPFGLQPGDGARMPDFRLAPDEVRDLSAFLTAQRETPAGFSAEYSSEPRSAFALRKASVLLAEKLSCLGCHRFGEAGGRIGPDLTQARQRLQPGYLLSIIRDPRAAAPHAIMPAAPLPDATQRLIADLLWQHDLPPRETAYLSPLDHPVIPGEARSGKSVPISRAQRNYERHCAACHGATGQGDGFNARFLPVKPTRHGDPTLMKTRPDDTLFDGIHAGGFILNKSQLMPAWGKTLSAEEIRELVGYVRSLCRCEGPAWSRDDSP